MSCIKSPKKLIEVALPLDDINAACAHEKQPGIGSHPRGLHLWWARRPLAAARAVLFAQMVNDPGGERGWTSTKTKAQAAKEREELFDIIRDLVKWENTNNESVLNRAREAIKKSWRETCELNKGKPGFNPEELPAFHDPFAGGGAIPLEAQRLGLESYASDLNPVAVMINKAMIEIPSKFAGQTPVGPLPKGNNQLNLIEEWGGARGLAEDVRRYGHWMWEQAFKRIGHLYPKVRVTSEMAVDRDDLKPYVGKDLTVIAWLWARTVKSSNPAFSHIDVPLVSSFVLSGKKGKEAWVDPLVDGDSFQFVIRTGNFPMEAKKGNKIARGSFRCLLSDSPITYKYIDDEANAGRMGSRLMAIVAEGQRGRVYLPPTEQMENIALQADPTWQPNTACRGTFASNAQGRIYGFKVFADYFTPRQLVALSTFSDLLEETRNKAIEDAKIQGMQDDSLGIDAGGTGATAYGDALVVYLSFAVDRLADYNSSIATWKPSGEQVMQTYKRQGIPMTWDFPESNIMGKKSICWLKAVKYSADSLVVSFQLKGLIQGKALLVDAAQQVVSESKVISTDPPYYDNIGYADLSDFFYLQRQNLVGL